MKLQLARFFSGRRGLVSRVVSVNMLAQLITFGASPILARLYEPRMFGEFAVATSIATVAAVVATLSLPQALHATTDRASALGLVRLSLILVAATSAAMLLAVLIGNVFGLSSVYRLLPLLTAATATSALFGIWATREGDFRSLLGARLAAAILGTAVLIAMSGAGTAGLLVGQCVGAGTGALWLALAYRRGSQGEKAGPLRDVWRNYSYFTRWRLPADLLNGVTSQIPLWLMSHAFGAATGGFFSMVHRVFNVPSSLVGNAMGEVFTREAGASYRKDGRCLPEFDHFARDLSVVAALLCLPVALAGPSLFGFVFGERWTDAGQLASLLSGWYFLRFAVSPLTSMLVIGMRPGLDLALQILFLAGMGLTAWLASSSHSLPLAASALTLTGAAFYGLNFHFARRLASGSLPAGKSKSPTPVLS